MVLQKNNLQRMAAYIRTIPQAKFNMKFYRKSDKDLSTAECKSIGCALGHTTKLFPELVMQSLNRYTNGGTEIDFDKFCLLATGIERAYFRKEDGMFEWCFSMLWYGIDNTPEGAARRIEYALANRLPEDLNICQDSEYMQYYVDLYNDWYDEKHAGKK